MKSQPRNKLADNWAWFAGSAIFAALLAIFIYTNNQEQLSPDTFCAKEPTLSTVVLLDRTDATTAQTKEEIVRRVNSVVESQMEDGERLAVFVIDDRSSTALLPRFDKCKPAKGSRVYQNQADIDSKAKAEFYEPLQAILRETFAATAESPIAEALLDIANSGFLQPPARSRLVIVSDFIQNTSQASMIKCTAGANFRQQFEETPQGKRPRPKWTNVQIVAHVILRSALGSAQIACRDSFWPTFFSTDAPSPSYSFTRVDLPGLQ